MTTVEELAQVKAERDEARSNALEYYSSWRSAQTEANLTKRERDALAQAVLDDATSHKWALAAAQRWLSQHAWNGAANEIEATLKRPAEDSLKRAAELRAAAQALLPPEQDALRYWTPGPVLRQGFRLHNAGEWARVADWLEQINADAFSQAAQAIRAHAEVLRQEARDGVEEGVTEP